MKTAAPLPLSKELVLIGGGHTHALVLRQWGMNPLAGARVTLINPGPTAPYTGMLPGHVAGHYPRDALEIDLVRLARFAGARLILGAAEGIDRQARRIHVAGRPPVPYDVASINIGITSDLPSLPGAVEHAVPAKPLGPYAERWAAFRAAALAGAEPPELAVIGGGVGGIELALAMAHALRDAGGRVSVIERGRALPGVAPRTRAILSRHMDRLGVRLIEGAAPAAVTAQAVVLADGREIPSRFTVTVAGARPFDWLAGTGLALDGGFVRIDSRLVTSDPAIFAVGDCATLPDPRPKAGVFAVREAPVLHRNLRAALAGTPERMRRFRPQRDYLKLVSLGEKSAVADKWGGWVEGPWVWRWKDRIDRRFMEKFTDLPRMAPPDLPAEHAAGLAEALGPKPLCGGCGAKVGQDVLAEAIGAPPGAHRPDVQPLPGDDAALLLVGGARQVITTDHLRAFTEDPYTMTRIAAVHALGDVWAMGAAPQAALASLTLPRMAPAMQRDWLAEIMAAARAVLAGEGAELVGGHTTVGAELTVGFAVTGLLERAPITLAGAQAGDVLIVTKPIGSGTVMAAEMALEARGQWVAAALNAMTRPQGDAARILAGAARAMTDVTGFGLAGHLMNICRASGVGARLDLGAVPFLEGAKELAAAGIRSTLFEANRAALAGAVNAPEGPATDLLFDPQTAGGLLAAVPAGTAAGLVEQLRDAGHDAAAIGEIAPAPPGLTVTG